MAAARYSLWTALGLLACGPEGADTEGTDTGGPTSTGTTGTTATGMTTGTPSQTTGDAEVCEGSVSLPQVGDAPTPSGYERCGDGLVHRAQAIACAVPQIPSNCPVDAEPGSTCLTNDDCTEKPFGSCRTEESLAGPTTGGGTLLCTCYYGCESDADCAEGEACRCAGPELGTLTKCVPADCRQDSDCAFGQCGLSQGSCDLSGVQLACQTPEDLCDSNSDCVERCLFGADIWACNDVICGRPFVVDAAPAIAPTAPRDDWRALLAAPAVPEALRSRLAAHWTRIALFEHASVASFARFILELLAVGAPPALLQGAQQALADEVEHARIGFALASLYAGTGVGPGPLPTACTPAVDLDAALAAAIAEACVAETLAGLELAEAAEHAEDPGLRRALARIAEDERRHAELGWRFVQWALQGADAGRRARASAAFAAALAGAERAIAEMSGETDEPELRAHGVVDAPLRAAVWRRGLDALVRPAATALCAA